MNLLKFLENLDKGDDLMIDQSYSERHYLKKSLRRI